MLIELTIINSLPVKEEGGSCAKYIPIRVHQKKLFNTENCSLEEHIDSKGKLYKKYSFIKYDNEYYKIKYPYEELKHKYFNKIEILGLDAKRNNYTNI